MAELLRFHRVAHHPFRAQDDWSPKSTSLTQLCKEMQLPRLPGVSVLPPAAAGHIREIFTVH